MFRTIIYIYILTLLAEFMLTHILILCKKRKFILGQVDAESMMIIILECVTNVNHMGIVLRNAKMNIRVYTALRNMKKKPVINKIYSV